jgi:hypothetical protein
VRGKKRSRTGGLGPGNSKEEACSWHPTHREKLALSSGFTAWKGLAGWEGLFLGTNLGLTSNAVCPVQPMGRCPRPCSRLTYPPWTMPPAPSLPTGAPQWSRPWCVLVEMEFALDARWAHTESIRSPTPSLPFDPAPVVHLLWHPCTDSTFYFGIWMRMILCW